ncbi:MAG: 5-formyltetrahydrofolate cyclo-ligase [Chloroflexi bacterium]|nr:5-formyltetrahydrofolate cyclo-ligase [Chloroflexota bacterium]MDA1002153.1 5-formyltetrahydrofolate cyclo-ligase [Chloroflexota bacterium]
MSSDDARAAKAALRAEMLSARRSLDPDVRRVLSLSIAERVVRMPAYRGARVLHAYIGSVDGEVETRDLVERALRAGKRVICPRAERRPRRLEHYEITTLDDLELTSFGLWEPILARTRLVPADELATTLDLVLVPGIVFDRQGWRIGFGAGYYDRFLAGVQATAVALAFSLQLRATVPHEPHDVPLDRIITEAEVIDAGAERERG